MTFIESSNNIRSQGNQKQNCIRIFSFFYKFIYYALSEYFQLSGEANILTINIPDKTVIFYTLQERPIS